MNILDRIFVGKIVKDFGIIGVKTLGIGRTTTSALLAQKAGAFRFVIKTSSVAFLGASISYNEFDLEDAFKIRQYIDQSEAIVNGSPYSETFDAAGIARHLPMSMIIYALLTFFIGMLILWWLNIGIIVLIGTLILVALEINSFQDFKRFEQTTLFQQAIPVVLAISGLAAGIIKFVLINHP